MRALSPTFCRPPGGSCGSNGGGGGGSGGAGGNCKNGYLQRRYLPDITIIAKLREREREDCGL